MTKMPVAGVAWLMAHYLVGFQRLGYEPYYVEAHGLNPSMFMEDERDDGSAKAAAFIANLMRRFDLGDRWAYQALHDDGRQYGLSEGELRRLYRDAALIVNLHGATRPLPEHSETDRLVYLETDPVELQIELHHGIRDAVEYLEPHCAFFSWALNYAGADCKVPLPERFHFRPTCPPVVLDFWPSDRNGDSGVFTTIGNWQQVWRDIRFEGERYTWSKHHEFLKVLDLPRRTGRPFELALSRYQESDRRMLEEHGWRVRDGLAVSRDLDDYRKYIAGSRGEFTVAKDQNVRLRSGWFSERSATYLAAGRPVITQETGFSNALPTGEGLFAFSAVEEAAEAIEAVDANYERHRRKALELALEHFEAEKVLSRLLEEVGLELRARSHVAAPPLPGELELIPVSRWPTTLPAATERTVLGRPVPRFRARPRPEGKTPLLSIVVATFDGLPYTRLCLESVLANTGYPNYEVVVVDNGSSDGTVDYLKELAALNAHVRLVVNRANNGFAAATNQGLAEARGERLLLLNNDTIVAPGWLARLVPHLDDRKIGLAGPLTNRAGNEAQIEVPYRSYSELLEFSHRFFAANGRGITDVRTLTLFCAAMRREAFERVGPLDERFGLGMFEDDDYAMRMREAGYRVILAEDAFVHHFGQATLGKLAPAGEYGSLFHANRRRFEKKWGVSWEPYGRRPSSGYQDVVARIRDVVRNALPQDAKVLVVSRGDDELLKLDGRPALHFPQADSGGYAGHHPADSADAIAQLDALRGDGGEYLLLPSSAYWWLDRYPEFGRYLEDRYTKVVSREDACLVFALEPPPADGGER